MIDLKVIRAAAEAAKGLPEGDWNYEPHGQTVWNGRAHMVCDIRGWGHLGYLPNGAELQDAMGRHIANLDPATILELLDRLEAAEAQLKQETLARENVSAIRSELAKQLEAAEKDAARYRWLRHGDNDKTVLRGDRWRIYLPRNGLLDAAIDAAMGEQK